MSRKRRVITVAALLLSETAACNQVPICDPVPPPPTQTSVVAAQPTTTIGPRVPICDPVPPPPILTSIAATSAALVATSTPVASAQPSPSATRTPTATPTRTTTPGPVRTVPPPICDPVPPPPVLTSVAATRTAQAGGTAQPSPAGTPTATPTPRSQTSTNPQRSPASEAAPDIEGDSSPSRDLPLQQRLRLSIVPVPGEEHVYRVEANFQASQVVWTASGGELEAGDGSVRWRSTRRGGSYLLQAVVDAGPLGVAVAARVIDS